MDCHLLLQGIFPTQGSKPGLLYCRQTLYCLSHQGSPPGKPTGEAHQGISYACTYIPFLLSLLPVALFHPFRSSQNTGVYYAIQQLPTSYQSYTQWCGFVNAPLPVRLTLPFCSHVHMAVSLFLPGRQAHPSHLSRFRLLLFSHQVVSTTLRDPMDCNTPDFLDSIHMH